MIRLQHKKNKNTCITESINQSINLYIQLYSPIYMVAITIKQQKSVAGCQNRQIAQQSWPP